MGLVTFAINLSAHEFLYEEECEKHESFSIGHDI